MILLYVLMNSFYEYTPYYKLTKLILDTHQTSKKRRQCNDYFAINKDTIVTIVQQVKNAEFTRIAEPLLGIDGPLMVGVVGVTVTGIFILKFFL
jgi:hypothetical protein